VKSKIKKVLTVMWFVGVTFGVLYSQDGVRVPLNRFFETGKFKLSEATATDTISYNALMTLVGDTGLVIVNPDKNLNRTTWAELIDTSCLRIRWTNPTGKLSFMWSGPTGTQYGIDTAGKFTAPGDVFAGNDNGVLNARYFILGSNSSGTLGALFRATADGVITLTNAGATGFSSFTVGAGAITSGFVRGTGDTDITALMLRSANGTLWYLYPTDAGTLTVTTTAP
jgi:hypothetical protein